LSIVFGTPTTWEVVLGKKLRGDSERVLATDRDQRVETLGTEVLQHLLDAAFGLVRIGASGAEDRPSARQDSRDLPGPELDEVPVDEAAPALANAHDRVPARERASRDRADHRVQARAIPSARQDSDLLRHRSNFGLGRSSFASNVSGAAWRGD
jgi:hypothetical protein